jgi:hypothetical protein
MSVPISQIKELARAQYRCGYCTGLADLGRLMIAQARLCTTREELQLLNALAFAAQTFVTNIKVPDDLDD